MSNDASRIGHLPSTLATWIYLLHAGGRPASDDGLRASCEAIDGAVGEEGDLAEHGAALADAVASLLESGGLDSALDAVYGNAGVAGGFGEGREERLRNVRRYQFGLPLPWLARIAERTNEGQIVTNWVLVEALRETVQLMDPYPWDRLEEEREMPLWEFVAKWELAGSDAWRVL